MSRATCVASTVTLLVGICIGMCVPYDEGTHDASQVRKGQDRIDQNLPATFYITWNPNSPLPMINEFSNDRNGWLCEVTFKDRAEAEAMVAIVLKSVIDKLNTELSD